VRDHWSIERVINLICVSHRQLGTIRCGRQQLVVALIAFGAITGMGALATGLNNAFSQIAITLTTNVS